MKRIIALILLLGIVLASASVCAWRATLKVSTPGLRINPKVLNEVFVTEKVRSGNTWANIPCVHEVTPSNFERLVLENRMPVVLKFYANWCHYCRLMEPIYNEVCEEYKGRLYFTAYDIDQDNWNIARNYGVRAIPTFLFFKDGEVVQRWVGATTIDNFRQQVENFINSI